MSATAERLRMKRGDGLISHCELQVGDSVLMLADQSPEMGAYAPPHFGGSPISLMLYVEDCDRVYRQALEAGAASLREPIDMPYGARMGGVCDPSAIAGGSQRTSKTCREKSWSN